MVDRLSEYGYKPTSSDWRYIRYNDAFLDLLKKKNIPNFIHFIYRWILSFDPQIGIKSLDLDFLLSHVNRLFRK